MLRAYRSLLYIYPAAYRHEFGDEMGDVFMQARAEVAIRSFFTRAGFYVREGSGLIKGAARAHLTSILGFNNGTPFRRFNMRPEFRFPRSTIVLMLVILAGVV